MGKLSKYLYGMMAAAMLAGCSDELPADDPGKLTLEDDGNGFFMALDIQMPGTGTGSRSETIDPDNNGSNSSGGIEVGSPSENNVTSALIVLAATENSTNPESTVSYEKYSFIAAGTVLSNRITTVNTDQYKAVARLQKENLEAFYNAYTVKEDTPGRGVYVFVFCNPTDDLVELFDINSTPSEEEGDNTQNSAPSSAIQPGSTDWMDQICTVIQGKIGASNKNVGIWGSNSFLMSNVKMDIRYLPTHLIAWEAFNAPENPFHLSEAQDKEALDKFPNLISNAANLTEETLYLSTGGPVKVQRAVARFDFRDGSKNPNDETQTNDNTYTVLSVANGENELPLVDVQIQKMCLVNMSKNFYYLLRVSGNGKPSTEDFAKSGFAYCAPELPWKRDQATGLYSGGNYVVGPNYETFDDYNIIDNNFSDYFNYPFFTDNSTDRLASFDDGNWDVVKVEDVLREEREDNYEGIDNPKPGEQTKGLGHWRVWRYVTENVIPAEPSNQRNGISTGIVFKAKLKGASLQKDESYQDEFWSEGSYKNIINCLEGKEFTYEGNPETEVSGNSDADPFLYYFDGHIYLGWRHIRQAAIQASVTLNVSGKIEINRSNSLYKAVFGNGPIPPSYEFNSEIKQSVYYYQSSGEDKALQSIQIDDPQWPYELNADGSSTETLRPGFKDDSGDMTPEGLANIQNYQACADYKWMIWHEDGRDNETLLAAMRKVMTGNDITIYQSSNDEDYGPGYYCYYYYWNRHNDNGVPGTMGPMEFAVVRNNVYKLSVDQIKRLGHPRIPDNDPDNPTPNTPDESDKIYLDVKVQIVPWVVRINNIVF